MWIRRASPASFPVPVFAPIVALVQALLLPPVMLLRHVPALLLRRVPALVPAFVPALVLASVPALVLALLPAPAARAQGEPLSAIDWLSRDLRRPAAAPMSVLDRPPPQDEIGVTALGPPQADGAGVIGADRAGLPADFWGATPAADLARLIAEQPVDVLPALNALLTRILLAELSPPVDAGEALLLARLDKLRDFGALDQAMALADQDSAPSPALFRRRFEMALLTGQEEAACAAMLERPGLAPGLAARSYCLARSGDWTAAATTLDAAAALGEIGAAQAGLIARFLEPELAEAEDPPPPPSPITPLDWRLLEAIGEPLPSNNLGLAFAQADLRANTGWKARMEAGERLARSGALDANGLHGLYTERAAAASGGVWDRVRAIQDLDAALSAAEAGETDRLALILPQVWARVAEAELEVPVAQIYGARLAALTLPEAADALVHRICLLAEGFETEAARHGPGDLGATFLKALALGNLRGVTPPDRMAGAVRDGFRATAVPGDLQALLDVGRRGEAVLRAMMRIAEGPRGDLRGVTEGLATLRAAGLEMPARAAALELLILDRRG